MRPCFASPSHEEIHRSVSALAGIRLRAFGVPAPGAMTNKSR